MRELTEVESLLRSKMEQEYAQVLDEQRHQLTEDHLQELERMQSSID